MQSNQTPRDERAAKRAITKDNADTKAELERVKDEVQQLKLACEGKNAEVADLKQILEGKEATDQGLRVCRGCDNQFSSAGRRLPRALNCGHTLCQSCVWSQAVINVRSNGDHDKKVHTCIVCNRITLLPLDCEEAGSAAKNYAILSYIDN
uniref:RING-type domain-containing protein n=1 Tax=Caenorhabditis tropicalis TaxID=1561998 RepID=A0A1I7TRI9_9PELO